MIASRTYIIVRANGERFDWQVPIPARSCSLVGHYTYKHKGSARKAAKRAVDRIFGQYGDMV